MLLWEVLGDAYDRLGFGAVGDESFKALVLGRIVEPTSKADTLRVLAELGVPALSLRTVFRTLARSTWRRRPVLSGVSISGKGMATSAAECERLCNEI